MSVRRAELLLLCVTLVAAAGWLFTKQALGFFTPYTFLALRFLLAAFTLGVFCYQDIRRLSRDQFLRCLLVGWVLGLALLSWVHGIEKTQAVGEGAFIVSLSVVVVPIIGRIIFGHRISATLLIALVPAVAGLALLSLQHGLTFSAYQWFFLASTLGFAMQLNLSGHFVHNIPPLALSTLQLGSAGIIALAAALMTGSWSPEYSPEGVFWLICSAVIATALRFALQTRALQHLPTNHASMFFLAEPVWTALLSAVFLNERMNTAQLMGCLLIFTSLLFYRGYDWIRANRD